MRAAVSAVPRVHASGAAGPAARALLLPPRLGNLRQERQHQGHLLEPQQHPGTHASTPIHDFYHYNIPQLNSRQSG